MCWKSIPIWGVQIRDPRSLVRMGGFRFDQHMATSLRLIGPWSRAGPCQSFKCFIGISFLIGSDNSEFPEAHNIERIGFNFGFFAWRGAEICW